MIFQNLMGPRKLRCGVPSGTTRGWACPIQKNNEIQKQNHCFLELMTTIRIHDGIMAKENNKERNSNFFLCLR